MHMDDHYFGFIIVSSHMSSFVFQGSFRPATSSGTSGVGHDLQQMEWVCPLPDIHSQLHYIISSALTSLMILNTQFG